MNIFGLFGKMPHLWNVFQDVGLLEADFKSGDLKVADLEKVLGDARGLVGALPWPQDHDDTVAALGHLAGHLWEAVRRGEMVGADVVYDAILVVRDEQPNVLPWAGDADGTMSQAVYELVHGILEKGWKGGTGSALDGVGVIGNSPTRNDGGIG